MRFNKGDKVRVKANLKGGHDYGFQYFGYCMEEFRGKEFVITRIRNAADISLDGAPGWSFSEEMLEPVDYSEKIVITQEGRKTVARVYEGKKVVHTAEAKCSPSDEYNFTVGAEIAFNRLLGKEGNADAPSKFKVGDIVIMINADRHESCKVFYPAVHTAGRVIKFSTAFPDQMQVQWEKGSTSQNDAWWVKMDDVRKLNIEDI